MRGFFEILADLHARNYSTLKYRVFSLNCTIFIWWIFLCGFMCTLAGLQFIFDTVLDSATLACFASGFLKCALTLQILHVKVILLDFCLNASFLFRTGLMLQ